jgi:hypothetical protein
MSGRSYYSVRTGRLRDDPKLELEMLRGLFVATYESFEEQGYFQERLGINCVDGYIAGSVGDVAIYSFRKLRRKDLFPIWRRKDDLTEDEVFDLIEFLYDHASQPSEEGQYHSWNQCGYHYSKFIQGTAQREFRTEVNEFLKDYGDGYELSEAGEILTRPGGALDALLEAPIPSTDASNITARVDAAVTKFRRRSASDEERRDAIRDLADVLEFLRPELKKVLVREDEADLFNIANNFGIRHHNARQRTKYDKMIWFSWIFYFYLATIHAAVRLIEKQVP